MKKRSDLVSVIVPCYNCAKFVERCFRSIANQTYSNVEVIFVNDGSTDNTEEVLKKLIKDNSNYFYYYKKNGGLSSARNYGLTKIHGEYVCFIDSDDYVEENFIELLHDVISNSNVNIAICDIKRIYNDHISINKIGYWDIEMCRFPAAWNKMYKTSLFKKYNVLFPEGKWYEDLGTTPKFTLLEEYEMVNVPLYNYVQNSSSIMHTYDNRIFQIYDIIEDLEKFVSEHDSNKIINLEFINIYHILIGTIFRASFKNDFDVNTIKKIYNYVLNKYPKWYKNKYITKLGIVYKVYLWCLRNHMNHLIFFIIKLFNRKVNL